MYIIPLNKYNVVVVFSRFPYIDYIDWVSSGTIWHAKSDWIYPSGLEYNIDHKYSFNRRTYTNIYLTLYCTSHKWYNKYIEWTHSLTVKNLSNWFSGIPF